MFAAVPLKRSLSRSVIRIIQRTLPLVKSRGRLWTTNAKTRMPIDMFNSLSSAELLGTAPLLSPIVVLGKTNIPVYPSRWVCFFFAIFTFLCGIQLPVLK